MYKSLSQWAVILILSITYNEVGVALSSVSKFKERVEVSVLMKNIPWGLL